VLACALRVWSGVGVCFAAMLALMVAGGCDLEGDSAGSNRVGEVAFAFGEVGTSPGQFAYPRAMAGDSDGLWIVDKQARVQRLVPRDGGAAWRSVLEFQMPEWALGKPTGLSVGALPTGLGQGLYVADTHYHRVMVYDIGVASRSATISGGSPAWQFGRYGRGPGEFVYPTDVALLAVRGKGGPSGDDGIERIYVSEYGGNDRVSVFEVGSAPKTAGRDRGEVRSLRERGVEGIGVEFLGSFGVFGEADNAEPGAIVFNRPQAIEVDAVRERLIVADAGHHRLGVFTLDGALVRWVGWPRTAAGQATFTYPYGLVLLADGTVLVAEFGGNRVQRVDVETGRSLGVWGKAGRGAGELASPWAVAVAGKDSSAGAYVLDSANSRVQRLDFEVPEEAALEAVQGRGGGR
jgi:hypothetical protein